MVNDFGRGQKTYMKLRREMETIRWIFEQIDVPEWWYSFDDSRENTLCFTLERDGIHTFIPERGEKKGELVFNSWYDAIRDAAKSFEPRYTDAIMKASDLVLRGEMKPPIGVSRIAAKVSARKKRPLSRSALKRRYAETREKARA